MPPATSSATRRDRFVGCLLGGAVGDGLGAPWEGLTSFDILHLGGPPHVLVTNPTAEVLYYTDDTEMTVGVAETLVEHGEILAGPLVRAFARNYHHERGYGRGARRILEAVQAGDDWDALADAVFPGGSLGNGAAMRVAPVG